MTTTQKIFLIFGGIALLSIMAISYKKILQNFLPTWENFSPTPYWDYKQWSWGYGTKVPGSIPGVRPQGTITRAQAMIDALNHIEHDYLYLKPLIRRNLSPQQWAALLSFSYNEGPGNADNLITDINSGNDDVLEVHWKKYKYAGDPPKVKQFLIDRRNAEWELWTS